MAEQEIIPPQRPLQGAAIPKLQDPVEAEELIDDYFASLTKTRILKQRQDDGTWVQIEEEYSMPPTVAGLALALGISRASLLNYSQARGTRDPRLASVIERAKLRIAEFAEQALYTRDGSRGAQFSLMVNFKYGKEDDGGALAETFTQQIIPPVSADGGAGLAIPVWGDDDDD